MRAAAAAAAIAILLGAATSASAHHLDECLMATTFSLAKDHVAARLRLAAGAAVAGDMLAAIDADGNGSLSDAEQLAYAQLTRNDLSLCVDGRPAQLDLVSWTFPTIDAMQAGLGDILLEFKIAIPAGPPARRLTYENRHQRQIGVYLVNCLLPDKPEIRVVAQERSYDQSFYQLDFTLDGAASGAPPSLDPVDTFSVAETYFWHGVHHILNGYDHLLFVGALALAATTFWDLVKIITAFTLAHSITLALATIDFVHVSERMVEPVIAASIVFVAAQNVFWPARSQGRGRLAAAFFFGLFHGLGFAGGLLDLMRQMPRETALLAILGFSAGIEAGHQLVVAPLFACLKAARHDAPAGALTPGRRSLVLQRTGSIGILIAGVYYLAAFR